MDNSAYIQKYRLGELLVGILSTVYHGLFSFGHCCRFLPSCGEYTRGSIQRFGFVSGVVKGVARILRCYPFSASWGYDPVPPVRRN